MFKKIAVLLIVCLGCNLFAAPVKQIDWRITEYEIQSSTYSYYGRENKQNDWWEIERALTTGVSTVSDYAIGSDNFETYYIGRSTMTYYSLREASQNPNV